MIFTSLPLPGAYRIEQEKIEDDRGFFARIFCETEFAQKGLEKRWAQINNSRCTIAGTLRGLHFQRPPMAECKLIRCIQGVVWDIIVDLRYKSPTFGQWHGEELSAENRVMIYIPKGFAHGYLALTDGAEIIYPASQPYSPQYEGSLHWADPAVGINWPIEPRVISAKDAAALKLSEIIPMEIPA